jgi:hypothetical protein
MILLIGVMLFYAHQLMAFDMVSGMMMNNIDSLMDSQEDSDIDKMTEEQKMTKVQAHIIETMFLKTLLEEDPILQMNKEEREEEDGGEDSGLVSMASEYSFYNKMITRQLSQKLAEKDLLKMTARFKNRGQAYNIDVPQSQGIYD